MKTTRKNIEQVAKKAGLEAARILRKYYETGIQSRHKGEVDLVTKADLESQKRVIAILSKAFPTHDILAEEERQGHDKSLDGPIWVVDPLDGTTNYAHGFPMFAVSIAYREGGETQFGLVYHPLLKELFIAHRGKGATLNGKRIHVSKIADLNLSLLATGFPYDRRTSKENNLDLFCHFEMAAQCVRRAGAAVLDLANVACGRVDAFWEQKLAPWDIAAGNLLVEEAGGKVTDYSGNPIRDLWSGNLLATNSLLHERMISEIASIRLH